MKKIVKTKYYSQKIGKLAKGCNQCVFGRKLVLFVTGICPKNCWYCPLSEKKKNKDVIYANEVPIKKFKDIITEAKLTNAMGAGITGGDPLSKINRTVKIVKLLKKEFSNTFHIHLYTSFDLASKENLKKIYAAGVDEIRFHADLDDNLLWKKIENARNFSWKIGIEIPVIPTYFEKIRFLVDFFEKKIDFLNLNELESAETNFVNFNKRNLKIRKKESLAIIGSYETAQKILKYCQTKKLDVHFCTPKLKDFIQMKNRIKLRAKNIKTKFDHVTDEGLLLRAVIYGRKQKIINFLINNKIEFVEQKSKNRIIISPKDMYDYKNLLKQEKFKIAVVEQYPTYDEIDTLVQFL
ncbi:MAG: radical SAM protein [Nanoarchaeota archaeon]